MPRRKPEQIKRKPMRIRTGDTVLIISGEGRSDTPRKVLGVLPKQGKVIVEGVNVMKDRQGNRNRGGRQAGINEQNFIEKPYPIDHSNVALIDPQNKKRTRVKMKAQADGNRVRVASRSGEII